jgi:hypothetical protein
MHWQITGRDARVAHSTKCTPDAGTAKHDTTYAGALDSLDKKQNLSVRAQL